MCSPSEEETREALTLAEWLSGQDDDEAEAFGPANRRDPGYGDPADRMIARRERARLADAIQHHAQAEYRKQHPTTADPCEAWLEAEQLRHEAGEFTLVGYKGQAGGIKTLSEWAEKRSPMLLHQRATSSVASHVAHQPPGTGSGAGMANRSKICGAQTAPSGLGGGQDLPQPHG